MKDSLKILVCLLGTSLMLAIYPFVRLEAQVMVPRPEDIYREAEEYLLADDYQEALPLYMELYQKGYASPNINFKIGTCYLNLQGMKTRAIPFLEDAARQVSDAYTGASLDEPYAPLKSYLYLGIARRIRYDFGEAERALKTYISLLDTADGANISLARVQLERIGNARELIASPALLKADTLPEPVSNGIPNFNPLVSSDETTLFFNQQLKFYDAVMQTEMENGQWHKPENITPAIRSDGDHRLTGVSADGRVLLLTAYDPYMSGEIFVTSFEKGRWRPLKPLNDHINTQFNETHASFSGDGQTLYFTSDRPGGYGGLDIYRSELDASGDWGPAVNLGPVINTAYNEETPFVASRSGTLFFSSQGHYNMGGFDVFASARTDQGDWQYPVNLGYPLNGTDDDLFYFVLPDGKAGYASVYASPTTMLSLVRFEIMSPANPVRYNLSGHFTVAGDEDAPVSEMHVSVIDRMASDTLGYHVLDAGGNFSQKLPGGSYRVEVADRNQPLYAREIEIPSYFPSREILLNAEIHVPAPAVADTLRITNLRFAFDQSTLSQEALDMLTLLAEKMMLYPDLTVALNGYADALGNAGYNLQLSIARAASAREYLSHLNISPERIHVQGFGESDPVALNRLPDGADSPEGRKYNRRVEIRLAHVPAQLIVIPEEKVPEGLKVK